MQSGTATGTSAGGDVQSQIQNAIKADPTLSSDNITVNVTDKDVELTGDVNSKKEKQQAKKIAEQYAGKLKVKDHLKVAGGAGMGSTSPSSTTSPSGNQNPPDNTSKPPDNPSKPPMSNNFLGQSSSSSQTSPSSQTGSSSSSTPDTSSPQQASPSSQTPSSSTGGVAGSASQTQSNPGSSSGAVGSNQSGTSSTTTSTTTTETQTSPASAGAGGDLQSQIQTALKNEPTLSNDSINVAVTDDAIDLTGSVATGKEKQTAKRIVQSYAGNRKVTDHLTVSGKGQDNMSTPSSTTNPSTNPDDTKKPPTGAQPPPK
jgi:osmotically-inducible protein OsmY